jgi:hypothetical protein
LLRLALILMENLSSIVAANFVTADEKTPASSVVNERKDYNWMLFYGV